MKYIQAKMNTDCAKHFNEHILIKKTRTDDFNIKKKHKMK